MYTPKAFSEPDVGANLDFVEQQGFGVLISSGVGGPVITHLPVLVERGQGRLCLLRGHVAGAHLREAQLFETAPQRVLGDDVVATHVDAAQQGNESLRPLRHYCSPTPAPL